MFDPVAQLQWALKYMRERWSKPIPWTTYSSMRQFAKSPLGTQIENQLRASGLPHEYWMRQFVQRVDRAWLAHNGRNPFQDQPLRAAWEDGRWHAIRGRDVGECPHKLGGEGGKGSAVARMQQRGAWFKGHQVGSVQVTM